MKLPEVSAASRSNTQRSAAALPAACAAAAVLLSAGCGGAGSGSSSRVAAQATAGRQGTGSSPASTQSPAAADGHPSALHVGASTRLPEAVQLPAVTAGLGGVLALAGLDAADSSLASVTLVDGGSASTVAQLPEALHDAAAASIAGHAYLFGGGNAGTASASILASHARAAHVGGAPAGAVLRCGRGDDRRHGLRRRRLHRDDTAAHDRRLHARAGDARRRDAAAPAALRRRRGRRRTPADRRRDLRRDRAAGDPLLRPGQRARKADRRAATCRRRMPPAHR